MLLFEHKQHLQSYAQSSKQRDILFFVVFLLRTTTTSARNYTSFLPG